MLFLFATHMFCVMDFYPFSKLSAHVNKRLRSRGELIEVLVIRFGTKLPITEI